MPMLRYDAADDTARHCCLYAAMLIAAAARLI